MNKRKKRGAFFGMKDPTFLIIHSSSSFDIGTFILVLLEVM